MEDAQRADLTESDVCACEALEVTIRNIRHSSERNITVSIMKKRCTASNARAEVSLRVSFSSIDTMYLHGKAWHWRGNEMNDGMVTQRWIAVNSAVDDRSLLRQQEDGEAVSKKENAYVYKINGAVRCVRGEAPSQ